MVSTTIKDKFSNKNCTLANESVRKFIKEDIKELWITDSGASRHITFRQEWLINFTPIKGNKVLLGDDGQHEVHGEGTVLIESLINGQWIKARIDKVLYCCALD
jgi:hypothetical protein